MQTSMEIAREFSTKSSNRSGMWYLVDNHLQLILAVAGSCQTNIDQPAWNALQGMTKMPNTSPGLSFPKDLYVDPAQGRMITVCD